MEMAFKCKGIECSELTEDIDKGVGQDVTVLIRDVTLVHSAGSRLYIGEDYDVILHLSAQILGWIC